MYICFVKIKKMEKNTFQKYESTNAVQCVKSETTFTAISSSENEFLEI